MSFGTFKDTHQLSVDLDDLVARWRQGHSYTPARHREGSVSRPWTQAAFSRRATTAAPPCGETSSSRPSPSRASRTFSSHSSRSATRQTTENPSETFADRTPMARTDRYPSPPYCRRATGTKGHTSGCRKGSSWRQSDRRFYSGNVRPRTPRRCHGQWRQQHAGQRSSRHCQVAGSKYKEVEIQETCSNQFDATEAYFCHTVPTQEKKSRGPKSCVRLISRT